MSSPVYPTPTAAAVPKASNTLGRVALVLGIVAFVCAFIPLINFVAGLVGVAGVIVGIVALFGKNTVKGSALTGAILSAVAIVVSVVLVIVYSITLFALFRGSAIALSNNHPEPCSVEPSCLPPDDRDTPFSAVFGETLEYDDGLSVTVDTLYPLEMGVFNGPEGYLSYETQVTIENETDETITIDGVPHVNAAGGAIPADSNVDSAKIPAGDTLEISYSYWLETDDDVYLIVEFMNTDSDTIERESAVFYRAQDFTPSDSRTND